MAHPNQADRPQGSHRSRSKQLCKDGVTDELPDEALEEELQAESSEIGAFVDGLLRSLSRVPIRAPSICHANQFSDHSHLLAFARHSGTSAKDSGRDQCRASGGSRATPSPPLSV